MEIGAKPHSHRVQTPNLATLKKQHEFTIGFTPKKVQTHLGKLDIFVYFTLSCVN
jgi:hypothetical protein